MTRAYRIIDVFTSEPLRGNPVAVVLDAEGLDGALMQRIAAWINLSETTFLLPPTRPEADYRLRIFTPRGELPFAGHPTLGSAHAAREAGRVPVDKSRLVQECGAGLIDLWVGDASAVGQIFLTLPPAGMKPLPPAEMAELEAALGRPLTPGIAPAIVDLGPIWIIASLPSAAEVLALKPDFARLAELERRLRVTGVTVFGRYTGDRGVDEAAIEVRSFAPSSGVTEDPVCGSGNGAVAVFQRERGLLTSGEVGYLATQGRCLGRDGRVFVRFDIEDRVRLGGACVTCAIGTLALP